MSRQLRSKPQRAAAQPFSLRLQPSTGLSSKQQEAFVHLLVEYLAAREMTAEGTQLRMEIHSVERELGVQDQADLACWAMDQPAVGAIHIKLIGEIPAATTGGWATASRSDRAVEPLVQLYRMGRVGAVSFFGVLCAFQTGPSELEAPD